MKEVYVLTIHDEDTFQILGIYDDSKLRITLIQLNQLYSWKNLSKVR